VSILDEMRSDLPEISDMTFGDKYLMIYICTSLFPILYMLGKIFNTSPLKEKSVDKLIDNVGLGCTIFVYSTTSIYLLYRFIRTKGRLD